MGKTKRVALYLRVSTDKQTVENQRIDLLRVAEQRGWTVVGEYIDHGISGAKGREHRPEFDRLCKDAAQGRIDLVASWAIDRLGRTLKNLVVFMDELQAWGVGLYLHQQQIDTTTAAGRAFLQMAGIFAEFERSIIVERVHAGLARAKAQGKRLGRPSKVTDRTRERIRELHAAGMGQLKIGRRLKIGTQSVRDVLGVGTVQRVLAP